MEALNTNSILEKYSNLRERLFLNVSYLKYTESKKSVE
jgi:hypothetical protein